MFPSVCDAVLQRVAMGGDMGHIPPGASTGGANFFATQNIKKNYVAFALLLTLMSG